ncbi:hypothetical protein Cadr_000028646 [Camelus dromedarius]|uniref:Uncharacterized protein n=1 Tax=Camelus dromedarius TaxID=9838 RepID=A0A5N4CHK7_CAMDR|nr:hypothetical protein Cadr_000028646 [Camelus dromedarius]
MVLGEGAATHLCPVRGGAGAGTGCGSPVAKVSRLWPPPGMSSSKLTLGAAGTSGFTLRCKSLLSQQQRWPQVRASEGLPS